MNFNLRPPRSFELSTRAQKNLAGNALKSYEASEQDLLVKRERLRDPNILPSRSEIFNAFPETPSGPGLSPWIEFSHDKDNTFFELLNREYIAKLSNYIDQRAMQIAEITQKPVTVLEIGAGDGRLTHFLESWSSNPNVDYLATDIDQKEDARWHIKPAFPVTSMDYREALEKYKPDVVISSWMPLGVDFSQAIRDTNTVSEYILIGEDGSTGGCCGDDWLTWGYDSGFDNGYYDDDSGEYITAQANRTPPYVTDGFIYEQLMDISSVQTSRPLSMSYDNPRQGHSSTVSFKREQATT